MINWEIFESGIESLDISPTMYEKAKTSYETVASHLKAAGLKCRIYPQGSFALGTVVRPFKNDKDQEYDIDMICEIEEEKQKTSAENVRKDVRSGLYSYEAYLDEPIEEFDRCFTLHYTEKNGIGFNMDLVSSVHEDNDSIYALMYKGIENEFAQQAIAITEAKENKTVVVWHPSNPAGYKLWFDRINKPFRDYASASERRRVMKRAGTMYASVEKVPSLLERSALQRVIQVLKRHRDVYYSRINNGKKEEDQLRKPISAIITTLTAKIAQRARADMAVYDLLQFVVQGIATHSGLLEESYISYATLNKSQLFMSRQEEKWTITNPVNPEDNYTDSWNKDDAQCFFKWVKAVQMDFLLGADHDQLKFITGIERGLGIKLDAASTSSSSSTVAVPNYKTQPVQPVKPWGE